MPFGLWTWVGHRNHVLDGVQIPREKGQFGGERGDPLQCIGTTIPVMCGSDAAFCQITLTTCVIIHECLCLMLVCECVRLILIRSVQRHRRFCLVVSVTVGRSNARRRGHCSSYPAVLATSRVCWLFCWALYYTMPCWCYFFTRRRGLWVSGARSCRCLGVQATVFGLQKCPEWSHMCHHKPNRVASLFLITSAACTDTGTVDNSYCSCSVILRATGYRPSVVSASCLETTHFRNWVMLVPPLLTSSRL